MDHPFFVPTSALPNPPPPPPPAPPVVLTEPRLEITVIACPVDTCRSVEVYKRSQETGDTLAYWQCRTCGYRWKERVTTGSIRAAVP